MKKYLIEQFTLAASRPGPDIAEAALLIAGIEYPHLDIAPYLELFDRMGAELRQRLHVASATPSTSRASLQIGVLNDYLFGELKFSGNRESYDDPRNSFLHVVLERRTGIPISLSVVYMEVARRAGIHLEGVNFPGHFLVRHPMTGVDVGMPDFIIDPFNEGALLSPSECRQRLEGQIPDDEPLDAKFFQTASKPDMLVRMLLNLKRLYVQMRSFPQARDVTDLLLAINPSGLAELRDRGLLAYHLNDFPSALRDLERYLHQAPTFGEEADRKDQKQLWEHVKTLRRRVSELN